jgi:YD repeat-containing protein
LNNDGDLREQLLASEQRSGIELINPDAEYFIEGTPDEPETYVAKLTLRGEDGQRVTLHYDGFERLQAHRDLLSEATDDFRYALRHGLLALTEQIGSREDEQREFDEALRKLLQSDE